MSNTILELRRLLSGDSPAKVGMVTAVSSAFLTVQTGAGVIVVPNTGGCGLGDRVLLSDGNVVGLVGITGADYGEMYPT